MSQPLNQRENGPESGYIEEPHTYLIYSPSFPWLSCKSYKEAYLKLLYHALLSFETSSDTFVFSWVYIFLNVEFCLFKLINYYIFVLVDSCRNIMDER